MILRCCCRSQLAAAAAWSSPLLLAAADSLPSHASADNPSLATVSQRPLWVLAIDHSTDVAARRSAAAAARRSAAPLPIRCSAAAPCSAAQLLLLAKLQQHLGACRSCSLLGFSPSLRPGRKTKDASRSVTCAAACLGCVSICRCSGLMPRAALCLGGHWVKMRPGAAVMAHPRRRMAVGCHLPRAQRGTSCCAVTGASSAALRGGECSPPHIFPRTIRCLRVCVLAR